MCFEVLALRRSAAAVFFPLGSELIKPYKLLLDLQLVRTW